MAQRDDPLLRSARREASVVLGLALAATAYTVTYCALFGYERDPATLTFILGFPDWVFWGIVTPWACCTVFAWWFGLRFMRDEPLGEEAGEEAGEEGSGEAHHA